MSLAVLSELRMVSSASVEGVDPLRGERFDALVGVGGFERLVEVQVAVVDLLEDGVQQRGLERAGEREARVHGTVPDVVRLAAVREIVCGVEGDGAADVGGQWGRLVVDGGRGVGGLLAGDGVGRRHAFQHSGRSRAP